MIRDLATPWFRCIQATFAPCARLYIRSVRHAHTRSSRKLISKTPLALDLREKGLSEPLISALTTQPFFFQKLSEVQQQVFHLLPELSKSEVGLPDGRGRDMLCKARTGTGKTIAFLVPALQARLNTLQEVKSGMKDEFLDELDPQSPILKKLPPPGNKRRGAMLADEYARSYAGTLIIAPTRELAHQIGEEAKKLLSRQSERRVHIWVGGEKAVEQKKKWRRLSRDVVVATPGRLLDFLKNDEFCVAMKRVETVILDEADMLLELGFRDDIRAIMSYLPSPEQRRTFLFSATMNKEVEAIAHSTLHENHRYIDCVPPGEDKVPRLVPQLFSVLNQPHDVWPHLLRLIAHDQLLHGKSSKIMLFAPTTKTTDLVYQVLKKLAPSLPAMLRTQIFCMHSHLSQSARSRISGKFRRCNDSPNIMVTSDVSARGVDYPSVTRVIQLGLPISKEMYVHRVGRTGRRNLGGRADLVLTDFETAFTTFELHDLAVKPLEIPAFADEVLSLAESEDSADSTARQSPFAHPVLQRLSDKAMLEAIQEALSTVDENTVHDIFENLFGHYYALRQVLRTTNAEVLVAVQNIVMGITGITTRPKPPRSIQYLVERGAAKEKRFKDKNLRIRASPNKLLRYKDRSLPPAASLTKRHTFSETPRVRGLRKQEIWIPEHSVRGQDKPWKKRFNKMDNNETWGLSSERTRRGKSRRSSHDARDFF